VNALARKSSSSGIRSMLATALLVGSASATTFVVDANGGFDFTDIPPAIAAASPGDVIVVHPGSYSGFTVTFGLSLVGASGVTTTAIQINNIASGPRVALTSFHCLSLSVTSCSVPVIVNDLTADVFGSEPSGYVIDVQSSTDVRFRGLQVPDVHYYGVSALRAWQSRVEITSSTLSGSPGFPSPDGFHDAGPGGIGVLCDGTSDVHISLSTIHGGAGGNNEIPQDFNGNAGNGGAGIQVQGLSKLLLTGTANDLIVGGDTGGGIDCTHDGYPGSGLSVIAGSYARSSSVVFEEGFYNCLIHSVPPTSGSVDFVTPIDPSLELSGTTNPGQVLTLVVHGRPGDSARIRLGRQAVVHDQPGSYEDELTNPLRIYDLGALPASGEATKHVTIPGSLPHGYLMVFQGTTTDTDGVTRFTQSAPVVVH